MSFSFGATHGPRNPPFASESPAPAAPAPAAASPKPTSFTFGRSPAPEKAESKPSIFGSNAAPSVASAGHGFSFGLGSQSAAPATHGFTFGSGPQSTAPAPPAPPTPSIFGGGVFGTCGDGAFGQPAAAAAAATAAAPSTSGGFGFGQPNPPTSLFGSSAPIANAAPSSNGTPSAFGGPSAFGSPGAFGTSSAFGAIRQGPTPAPPHPTIGGFRFSSGGGTGAPVPAQTAEVAPSTAAAAEVAKTLSVISFGAEVKPADMGRPHPATFQVPPTSSSFSTPALAAQESKPALPAMTSGDAAKKPQEVANKKKEEKKQEKKKKKKKALNGLVIDEDEGSVRFPSREDAAFRYRLSLTKSDKIKIWLEDKSSKHQWESTELELSEVVTEDSVIPGMELKDYFEGFKSCLAAADANVSPSSSCDLLSLDKSGELQLELSPAIVIFAKVLTPTYKFKLQPVQLSEMDIVNAKLRDQDEEIRELRDEVDELSEKLQAWAPSSHDVTTSLPSVSGPAVFLRAVTSHPAYWNQPLEWTTESSGLDEVIQAVRTHIRVLQAGVYSVQVVVHHSHAHAWTSCSMIIAPPAFQLFLNDVTIASCYGSSEKGVLQSSSLQHILQLKQHDVLKVVYSGANQAKEGSYINMYMMK